jgi:hypothetical protein
MRDAMASAVDTYPTDLDCTLYVFPPPHQASQSPLAMLARSRPFDERIVTPGRNALHASIYAALIGASDWERSWSPLPAFVSNDLSADARNYFWPTIDQDRPYRSLAAFPLHLLLDDERRESANIGVVVFSSPLPDVFRGIPNSFRFASDPAAFRWQAEMATSYHIGRVLAQLFAGALGQFYLKIFERSEQAASAGRIAPRLPSERQRGTIDTMYIRDSYLVG